MSKRTLSDDSLDTPSGFWLPQINFSSENQVSDGITTSPAQTGTNILEYGRLSERTGDLQYLENVGSVFSC